MNTPETISAITTSATAILTLWFLNSMRQESARAKIATEQRKEELDAKLALIQAETKAAKERAEYAALSINHSREERFGQLEKIEKKIDESSAASTAALNQAVNAADLANNTNIKIKELREDFQSTQVTKQGPSN